MQTSIVFFGLRRNSILGSARHRHARNSGAPSSRLAAPTTPQAAEAYMLLISSPYFFSTSPRLSFMVGVSSSSSAVSS
jgi:hypothetical protein